MTRIAPEPTWMVKCGEVDAFTGRIVRCLPCQMYTEQEPPKDCPNMVNLLPEIKY